MAQGAGLLAGRALRGGRWSLVGLALVTALGGGAAIGAAVAADRTEHAYGEYLDDAEVADLVVNPSISTQAMDEAIRGFDDVESVRASNLLFASVSETGPLKLDSDAGEEDQWLQVLGSVDGRYIDVDRPAVTSGRVPSGEREIFVSNDYRDELEAIEGRPLHVGDTVPVGFFWAGLFLQEEIDPEEVIDPLGVEQLRISGFGVLPDEVLPDELWPRQRLIVSPDVTARYYCLPDLTRDMSEEEALAAFTPEDCSAQYDYYSLRVTGGAAGVRSVRDQFEAAAAELSEQLPAAVKDDGTGYFYISQDRSDQDDAVRETVRPTVTALRAFALVAALATLTIVGLMVARQTRREVETQRSLRAVGATRSQIAAWATVPVLVAIAAGVVLAVAVAFAMSPVGPLGTVRSLDPSPSPSLPADVVIPLALALAVTLGVVTVAVVARSAWRTANTADPAVASAGRLRRAAQRGRPAVATGVGAALDARAAGAGVAAMLGCVVATAVASAAIVFGASLSELVDDPESYGWPWDLAVITGAGYGDTDPAIVDERLAQDDVVDDVVHHAYYSFDPAVLLDGEAAPAVFGFSEDAAAAFPVLEGRPAQTTGEAVVGTDTADRLAIEVGDEVALRSSEFGEADLHVVGVAALPSLGSLAADRTGLGTGAFVLLDADTAGDVTASLTAIQLREGVDPSAVLERLEPDLKTWSQLFEPPVALDRPVRSPEIVNVSELRLAPLVLGGALLASLALGLWLAVNLSVRDRRRELAVLRAIGFGDRDVQHSVRWQGLTLVAVGLAVGVPLGVVGGKSAWRAFADNLGVPGDTTVPLSWLLGLVMVTVILGWIAVALPARAAARLSAARELQAQ